MMGIWSFIGGHIGVLLYECMMNWRMKIGKPWERSEMSIFKKDWASVRKQCDNM